MMGFDSQTLADMAAITLMAFCATIVCGLLTRHSGIGFFGVAPLVVAAGDMMHSSWEGMAQHIGIS